MTTIKALRRASLAIVALGLAAGSAPAGSDHGFRCGTVPASAQVAEDVYVCWISALIDRHRGTFGPWSIICRGTKTFCERFAQGYLDSGYRVSVEPEQTQ